MTDNNTNAPKYIYYADIPAGFGNIMQMVCSPTPDGSQLFGRDPIKYVRHDHHLAAIAARIEEAARAQEKAFRKGVNPEKHPDYIRALTPEDAANALKAREDEAERRGMERAIAVCEKEDVLRTPMYCAKLIRAEIDRLDRITPPAPQEKADD